MKPLEQRHDDIRSMSEGQLRDFAHELERKTNYLGIIYQFALSILDINNLDELMWYVSREVVARMGFRDCVIYQIDASKHSLVQKAACGIKNPYAEVITNQLEISFDQGIVGAVVCSGKPILVNDLRNDSRYLFDVEPALSELAVPIIYKGEILGVIDCEDFEVDYFNEEHLKILTTVASILSTKIAQTMMVDRLEASIKELEYAERLQSVLFNIATLAYTAEDLKEFYQSLHEVLGGLLYAKNLTIGLYSEERDELDVAYACNEISSQKTCERLLGDDFKKSLCGYALDEKFSISLNRKDISALIEAGKIKSLDKIPCSWLGVPFMVHEAVYGIIVIQSFNKNILFGDRDKEVLQYVSNHISSTINRRFSEKKLQHQALHDALTGLPNRLLLVDRISHALARLIRGKSMKHALLFIDLDRFKTINDSLGHLVGDKVLQSVCQKINNSLRAGDTLARLGGDEFAILIEDIDDGRIFEIAQRINKSLNETVEIDEHKITSSASIGITYADNPDLEPFELLQQADTAMYKAKSVGPGNYCEYDKTMHQEILDLAQLEFDITTGLIDNEFILYYQPIFNIANNELIGFEALARWAHPKRGLLNPEEFIDHAESTAHIIELDNAMLVAAAKQIEAWFESGAKLLSVNVNVSSKNFSNPSFVSYLKSIYEKYQLPRGSLCIEITERALIDNLDDAKRAIESIRNLGAKIALDDFGTGYSSLSYLHKLPMDTLKIDKSFVQNINDQADRASDGYPIISAIVALAKSLDLKVVAEGIEEPSQLKVLNGLGCDYGQGFLLSEPLSANDAFSFMQGTHTIKKN